jgi:cytochrome c oxidase subunit II
MIRRITVSLTLLFALLNGCSGPQSALDPVGPQASRISNLWWLLFAVCLAIFLLVIGCLLYAGVHRRRETQQPEEPRAEQRRVIVVSTAVAVSILIVFLFLIASVRTGNRLSELTSSDALTIDIIGHQWWWEVHYHGESPSQNMTTANEVHIPVGRPVLFKLTSQDVIHSFWAPNLHGKRDLIPGHETTLWLQADRPGVFRGQCAEFCGHQHAHMAFVIVAELPEQFAAWLDHQRQPASPPADELRQKGQTVFVTGTCVLCHSIQGTDASAQVAPDLTHIASRRTLAAGTVPNTQGHLAGWVLDPQTLKPGAKMPSTPLTAEELHALLAYLEGLQ